MRQENHELEASLGYIEKPYLKERKKKVVKKINNGVDIFTDIPKKKEHSQQPGCLLDVLLSLPVLNNAEVLRCDTYVGNSHNSTSPLEGAP